MHQSFIHASALKSFALALAFSCGFAPLTALAQDRLKTMPGYEQYQKVGRKIGGSVKSGSLSVDWAEDGKSFDYRRDDKRWRFDIAAGKATEAPAAEGEAKPKGERAGRRVGTPERGRQVDAMPSPDGKLQAFCRDRNLYVKDADGANERAITTQGNAEKRIKFGTASWVYGEELDQNTAFWWSPDSSSIAFYRFDESPVKDYFLQMEQTKLTTAVDVRSGKPFEESAPGYYVYKVDWSKDGGELLFNRTNRRQNVMEFCAAERSTGKTRVIVREEWPQSWTENAPAMRFLEDGKRFLWTSERTGWNNFYLYDLSGKLLSTVTKHEFEVANIVKVDEVANTLYYMARSGDNHMKLQLHRVGLDGKGDVRLTDPALHHSVDLAPDGRHFIDVAQAHDVPATTRLVDGQGKLVAELAKADTSSFEALGLERVELFSYKAADGVTELHGMLHFPSDFDPAKQYPLLVSVYAGPATNGARETFSTPSSLTEYGFLYATLDSRSAGGRGKRFLDSIYLKLGTVEIDDQAAGVKALWDRPYLKRDRVGIFGTSYGGYASALALLRYPDVFQAACASSAVTDWRHYDTIYTERYQWTPQENKAGYDSGSAMTYVDNLKGRLMLYYGTADNNVHPNNTMQLVRALQSAGKSFELQAGPDLGHSGLSTERMMEFFIENLVMR